MIALRREIEPVDAVRALRAATGERFFLERPAEGTTIVASGCLHRIAARGKGRFDDAAERAGALLGRIVVDGDPGPAAAGPLVVGGFSFDDAPPAEGPWAGFGPADLVLPELLLVQREDRAWITAVGEDPTLLAVRVDAWLARLRRAPEPSPQPGAGAIEYRTRSDPPADYLARVTRAIDDVGAGELEKVVVARSVRITGGGWDVTALVDRLRRAHPRCATFLVTRGDACFLGASPERMLRREGDRLTAMAVAGSAPRGRSPEADRRHARALAESKKEQAEHAVVVRYLRERLGTEGHPVEHPEAPAVMALEGIQHLATPVRAAGADARSAIGWAGRLHPTPAVAGAPPDAARAWLARHEPLDRGWYAAPIGFCDAEGDGEFWVALRSALLRGDEARLFAGAGVVADSDPDAELRETRLKLTTLLAPLMEL